MKQKKVRLVPAEKSKHGVIVRCLVLYWLWWWWRFGFVRAVRGKTFVNEGQTLGMMSWWMNWKKFTTRTLIFLLSCHFKWQWNFSLCWPFFRYALSKVYRDGQNPNLWLKEIPWGVMIPLENLMFRCEWMRIGRKRLHLLSLQRHLLSWRIN